MSQATGRRLVFPSLEWFRELRELVNADPEFRRIGSIDTSMGVKVGPRVFVVTFEAFECSEVREAAEADLANVDFYLELAEADWREMIENIRENEGADRNHTLNTLDLMKGISSNAAGDQFLADMFFRVNQSLQYFFDLSSKLDTAFES